MPRITKLRLILVCIAVILVAGLVWVLLQAHRDQTGGTSKQTSLPTTQTRGTEKKIDHIVIIIEENKPVGRIIGNGDAPYINSLVKSGAYASDYHAITNPSLPNYIALTSGTNAGITNDCNPPGGSCVANVTNIADRIEASGRSWKMYAESMPAPCTALNSGDYAVKHNPFMYYPDIAGNATRCQSHVVPFSDLQQDLGTETSLPDYVFISPNLCNDMHNCSVKTGDTWLSEQAGKILASPAFTKQNSLLVLTWDEGNIFNNHIPTVFAGPAAKRGFVSNGHFDHYSLLHTIEDVWSLQPLTSNDAVAPGMQEMLSGR